MILDLIWWSWHDIWNEIDDRLLLTDQDVYLFHSRLVGRWSKFFHCLWLLINGVASNRVNFETSPSKCLQLFFLIWYCHILVHLLTIRNMAYMGTLAFSYRIISLWKFAWENMQKRKFKGHFEEICVENRQKAGKSTKVMIL